MQVSKRFAVYDTRESAALKYCFMAHSGCIFDLFLSFQCNLNVHRIYNGRERQVIAVLIVGEIG